jgi:hypothetical protein
MSLLDQVPKRQRSAFLKFSARYSRLEDALRDWGARERKAERAQQKIADPFEATRRKEPTPEQLDARMRRALEELRADAVPVPVESEPDPELIAAQEAEARTARRKDTLRRMHNSAVIAQRNTDGTTKFKDDPCVRDSAIGSSVHNKPTGGQ